MAERPQPPAVRSVWFGPPARPLFGRLHVPPLGRARGGVVVCNSVGAEAANLNQPLRALAERLAGDGLVALRFDYDGTGDSAGSFADPDRLEAWIASVGEALAFARGVLDGPVALVGARLGALLAAHGAARDGEVAGLVLWDPCGSGRLYLREQETLLATGYGATQRGDGSLEAPAFVFSPEAAASLRSLEMAGAELAEQTEVLVLTRQGRSADRRIAEALQHRHVDWDEATEQARVLDVPPDMVEVPSEDIERVAAWLGKVLAGPEERVVPDAPDSAVVARDADRTVTERSLALGRLPLFAIESVGDPASGGPTVVLLSAGALDHTGVGRLWTDLARRWALEGVRVVRVDQSGLGESGRRPGQIIQSPKPAVAIDDLYELASGLDSRDGAGLVFVGISSGGYHAVEAATHLRPDAVAVVNGALAAWVPEIDEHRVDPRRRAYRPMPAPLRRLAVRHKRVAETLWRIALQLALTAAPMHPVAAIAWRGTPILVVSSERDAEEFQWSVPWRIARRLLERRRPLRFEVLPGDDHSLYTRAGREPAVEILSAWVLERCAAPAGR